jgi:RNA polymerase sigma factor (sigma-70 family)
LYSRISDTIRIIKRKENIEKLSILNDREFQKTEFEYPELLNTPYSDKQVFLGLQTLNDKTLRKVYQKSFPEVERMVKNYHGNTMDAEDVFQTALMILIEKIDQGKFNDESTIYTYLYKIALYVWMNELRSGYRNKILVYDRTDENYTDGLGSINIEYPEDFNDISEGLENLSPTCKILIEAWLYRNEKWEVIAKEQNYKNAAVASNQKYKCLEQLRKKYN